MKKSFVSELATKVANLFMNFQTNRKNLEYVESVRQEISNAIEIDPENTNSYRGWLIEIEEIFGNTKKTNMKHYMDIVRLGHKSTTDVLNIGDRIVVQEKTDGANASFTFDKDNDGIAVFSRRTQLNSSNTLGGFYNWVQEMFHGINLTSEYIYFGEWLNPHKITYPEKTFYLFDIFDTTTNSYLPFDKVKEEANRLGLNLVPVFYEGEYQGFEHLQSFVGKTMIGGKMDGKEMGEGVVVKNTNYKDRFGNQVFVKLVTDAFREVQQQKAAKDPSKELSIEQQFVNTYVPKARVEKFLYKFIDEGILDPNWGVEDISIILKNMNNRVFDDLMKEESDYLPHDFDDKELRKSINRVIPKYVKEIAKEKM